MKRAEGKGQTEENFPRDLTWKPRTRQNKTREEGGNDDDGDDDTQTLWAGSTSYTFSIAVIAAAAALLHTLSFVSAINNNLLTLCITCYKAELDTTSVWPT